MGPAGRVGFVLLMVAALIGGCAPPRAAEEPSGPAQAQRPAGPKRLVAAIMGDPDSVSRLVNPTGTGTVPGVNVLEGLLHAGLVSFDNEGTPLAQLAEAAPSLENGLWTVFPDGRMETIWRIRREAQWHDGAPFTSADILFTAQVAQDRELPLFRNIAYNSVESVEAPDSHTVRVLWKSPFIGADTLFTRVVAFPLAQHLLERTYVENKPSLVQLPYWNAEFVGAGPFKLREWVLSSHLVMDANDRYVLGRPKIDEVEVRFIPDSSTLVSNILAGAVELTLGRSISLDQALLLRDQWKEGAVDIALVGWNGIYPQLLNPTPPIVANLPFRKALLHAIDRQALADTLQGGVVPVADTFVSPGDPLYKGIESRIVRHAYDPRQAVRMIEALGYSRGPDGFFRDGAGQRLSVEVRATAGDDLGAKKQLSVTDFWRIAGVSAEPLTVSRQQEREPEFRSLFAAFLVFLQPNDLLFLRRMHGAQTPLPENSFLGNNRSRYRNPQLDSLIDRFFTTIPTQQRTEVLGQIVELTTDQLNLLGLFYHTVPAAIGKRVKNVPTPKTGDATSQSWNAHEWDVQ